MRLMHEHQAPEHVCGGCSVMMAKHIKTRTRTQVHKCTLLKVAICDQTSRLLFRCGHLSWLRGPLLLATATKAGPFALRASSGTLLPSSRGLLAATSSWFAASVSSSRSSEGFSGRSRATILPGRSHRTAWRPSDSFCATGCSSENVLTRQTVSKHAAESSRERQGKGQGQSQA